MDYCPDWYPLIQAAKYLGVPPWDLAAQPVIWRNWAFASMRAEDHAQKQKGKLSQMRDKFSRGRR